MNDTTNQPVATQPTATVPPVADIPPDPNSDSAVTGSPANVDSMSVADQSIHMSGDWLTAMYVGPNKVSKYKTDPLPEMLPAYLYRCTSAMAQHPMAMMRWVIDSWLARVFNEHGANNLLVDAQWWGNAPAHLRYEAALELARVEPEWRPYALATWSIMAATSKAKGSPDITAKLNPYDVILNPENAAFMDKMHDDAVCALRYHYDPSPYQMYGRGVHQPSADPVDEWVRSKRDPAYVPAVDCGAALLSAVKAGIRLFRGCGARKVGQDHADFMRPATFAFDPATQLVDQNLQVSTAQGIARGATDDTTLYLNTTPAWQRLFAHEMYGSYATVLMQPPADEATGTVQYTDEYHAQVTQALSLLPRWSMLFGDSGDPDGERPFTIWEHDDDPKPLTTAASTIAQTIQAIGLFGPVMPPSALIDGVNVPTALVSKVDPLMVAYGTGTEPPTAYAEARLAYAPELADLTKQVGKTKKPMPAHQTVLKALEDDKAREEWLAKQTDPTHRADVADIVGEIEFVLMVLRQVQLRQAEAAIDANIATTLKAMVQQGGPADTLSRLSQYVQQVHRDAIA